MENRQRFWWITLARGFVAILTGCAVMIIPDMASTLLLLPVALAIAILSLAIYGVLDSLLVFATSYMTTSRTARFALRLQGASGVAIGILLYLVFFDQMKLYWFLSLVALQALCTAIGEFLIAKHSRTPATSHWNFAAAAVACVFSGIYLYVVLALAAEMSPRQISWLIFGYLLFLGIAECTTSVRMLYSDSRPRIVGDLILLGKET